MSGIKMTDSEEIIETGRVIDGKLFLYKESNAQLRPQSTPKRPKQRILRRRLNKMAPIPEFSLSTTESMSPPPTRSPSPVPKSPDRKPTPPKVNVYRHVSLPSAFGRFNRREIRRSTMRRPKPTFANACFDKVKKFAVNNFWLILTMLAGLLTIFLDATKLTAALHWMRTTRIQSEIEDLKTDLVQVKSTLDKIEKLADEAKIDIDPSL